MPNILTRNPFHHHHNHNHSGSNIDNYANGVNGSTQDANDTSSMFSEATGTASTIDNDNGKRRKPFLNFMNVGSSNVGQTTSNDSDTQSSVLELKRFLRPSLLHNDTNRSGFFSGSKKKEIKRPMSPGSPVSPPKHDYIHNDTRNAIHTQTAIPPSTDSVLSLANTSSIYQDDTILAQKYGKLGKTLGSGAGGSVKILKRPTDGATFAVKEFRPKKPTETSKQYAKKCIAEFTIGSTLHHVNVIETMDIFSDAKKQRYFEVMEYCPVDFFAVVMSGKMSRGEVNCCLKQLACGVKYLHSMGLAHRDLKLDNCVMTENGILKLIDFGSAVVFRYPFEQEVTLASGIVGSDPYLAPEVLGKISRADGDESEEPHQTIKIDKKTGLSLYDPQAVDVWSIGIIFSCMMLKRFPWKAPKESDPNFKLYNMPEDEEHDYDESAKRHERLMRERRERRAAADANDNNDKVTPPERKNTDQDINANKESDVESVSKKADQNEVKQKDSHEQQAITKNESNSKKEEAGEAKHTSPSKRVIHGQYRLLRLLPHASRPIMSRMMKVNPAERATMDDIFNDEWFKSIPMCTIKEGQKVLRAHGHHHTVVKDNDGRTETYKV